jgi:glutathione S-transferase
MPEIILHHYPESHFAEKIRRILAFKGMPWRGVEQPFMMPKPDLIPLTGGNRRISVLQIGADIYCDTSCIARRLEQLQPEPSCIPPAQAGVIALIEEWAGHRLMFQTLLPIFSELLPVLPPEFLVDRAAMSPGLSKDAIIKGAPHALSQALISLDRLDGQLRDRPFLLGNTFSLADAACFFPLWLVKNDSPTKLFATVTARPTLAAWFARIEGFGPGKVQPMTPTEALAIARESQPMDVAGGELTKVDGLAVGDSVSITADDYGIEESRGTVARLATDEITIRRQDPSLGEIAVHFPRSGYHIVKQ